MPKRRHNAVETIPRIRVVVRDSSPGEETVYSGRNMEEARVIYDIAKRSAQLGMDYPPMFCQRPGSLGGHRVALYRGTVVVEEFNPTYDSRLLVALFYELLTSDVSPTHLITLVERAKITSQRPTGGGPYSSNFTHDDLAQMAQRMADELAEN